MLNQEKPPNSVDKSPLAQAFASLRSNRLAFSGLVMLSVIIVLAIAAPFLPLANPYETSPTLRLRLPLQDGFILGSDHLGRDILSRLIWGTRLSFAVGLTAAFIAAGIGGCIGLLAGYAGRHTDNILMRAIDMLMAFPYILLALAIVAVLGPGLLNALYAIAVVNIPFFARNIRGSVLVLARQDFIAAAKLSGKRPLNILMTEILPNVLPIIVITMTTTMGWMILETAGLSFLGLGAQPPLADLGSMLGEGRKLLFTAPHVSVIPGLMIFIIVIAVNILGDGIRDALDPRLQSGDSSRPSVRTAVRRADNQSGEADNKSGLLRVRNLRTEFTRKQRRYAAVREVSFTLNKGECLGIIGESGSGKSVTALSLLGLLPSPPAVISGGEVFYKDGDLLSLENQALRRLRGHKIAYIFQDPLNSLHPLFTIGEQICEALQNHRSISRKHAWDEAGKLLSMVRIANAEQRLHDYPHQLSGGQRQRVLIAMALAHEADILIADEPTTALDVTVQAQILSLLKNLQERRGLSLLFITHDFGVIGDMCDKVAVMYGGQIIELASVDDILSSPLHPYTARLIESLPIPGIGKKRLPMIDGTPPNLEELPEACAFAERCLIAEDKCFKGSINLTDIGGRKVRCLKPLSGKL